MTKLEFIDKINDILIGLNTAESDALGSLYDELMRDNDWQQVRIQFVGQIASAIISNYEFYAQGIAEECKRSGKSRPEMVAQMSVEISDALVAELQKEGGQR